MNEQEILLNASTDTQYTGTILSDPSELGNTDDNKKIITKTAIVFVIAGLLYQGSQLLFSFIFSRFFPEVTEKLGSNLVMIMMLVTDLLILLPVFFLLCKNIPTVKSKPSKLGAGTFATALLISYFFIVVGAFAGSQISSLFMENNTNLLTEAIGGGSTLLRLISVGIVGPICEELVFRKLLIDRFSRFGNTFAVIVSGLMFGLFHVNLQQFFYAFALGVIFGYIYVKTRNIVYSSILHMIINSYTSVLVLWGLSGYGTDLVKTAVYNLSLVLEVVMALVGCVLYIISVSKKKIKITENAVEPGNTSYMFQNWALWLFYIAMIGLTVFVTIKTSAM